MHFFWPLIFFSWFLTSGNPASLFYPPDPPFPFASHPFLAIESRPAPQRASTDPSWPVFLLFMNCPAVVLGFLVYAHPHTIETSGGELCFRPGHRWPRRLNGKKRKADCGRQTLWLFTAMSFCSLYMWLILFSRCLSEVYWFLKCFFFFAVSTSIYLQQGQVHLFSLGQFIPMLQNT